MFGAAAATRPATSNTVLDYFLNRFNPGLRASISILTNCLGIALFAYPDPDQLHSGPKCASFQTSAGLGLTLDYVFAAIPVGSVMMIVPMLRNIYF